MGPSEALTIRLADENRRRYQNTDFKKVKPTFWDSLIERLSGAPSVADIERNQKWSSFLKGPYVDFVVGGANAAGRGIQGISYLPFGPAMTGDYRLYRNDQMAKLRKDLTSYLKTLKDGDPRPRVWGHSWGGSAVANLAKEFPDVSFTALDPVSWFNRLDKYPDNLRVFQPNPATASKEKDLPSRLARIFGGAWPTLPADKGKTIMYDGGHCEGVEEAVTALLRREYDDRMASITLHGDKKDVTAVPNSELKDQPKSNTIQTYVPGTDLSMTNNPLELLASARIK